MNSWHDNVFCITGPLWIIGELSSYRAINAKRSYYPGCLSKTVEHTIELSVIWAALTLMCRYHVTRNAVNHDDVIKWKHFPRNWPFVWGIHRSPVNSPHKGQWRGALMFSLICVWINDWVNNREAGDLRRYRAHYDVIVMYDVTRDPNLHIQVEVEWMSNYFPYKIVNMINYP